MDNISHRYSNEDTTTSMYLSFDADSTMSTACYKTLEAMTDTSILSVEMNDSKGNNQKNRTLEMHMNSENVSSLETVKKKVDIIDGELGTPLKALPKNILKEYKAVCSTPSKEQLLKNVDVSRGSDTTGCVDLGLAFLDLEDGKPAFFPPAKIGIYQENKENVLPDVEEVSTLSTCSSVETTTSVIERKMCSLSDVGHITNTECVSEREIEENVDKFINPNDKLLEKYSSVPPPNLGAHDDNKENVLPDSEEVSLSTCSSAETTSVIEGKVCPKSNVRYITGAESVDDVKVAESVDKLLDPHDKLQEKYSLVNNGCENQIEKTNCEESEIKMRGVDVSTKSNGETRNVENLESVKEENFIANGLQSVEDIKPQIAELNRKTRLSVCEPNLKTGKPSRIFNSNNKRRSLLPTSKKPPTNNNPEIEIPMLIKKMLKITDSVNAESKDLNKIPQNTLPIDKRRSLISKLETRASLLTSAASNKRPFSFTQRMSVVVRTTLNSPARKVARRSALQPMQRKSIMPQTTTSTDSTKFQKGESSLRKSMVPKHTGIKISMPSLNNLGSLQTTSTKTSDTSSQRKTLEKDKLSQRKADISYACNVCKDKFSIKSLLDAHKRSHESDNSPPAFIRKASAIKQPISGLLIGNQNQCKYCDKKFALTKALHIHLLQNCLKIPPSEKRKLQYTDLNHVEKAQLPNVFPNQNLQSNAFSTDSVESERLRCGANKTKNITKTSSESLNDKKVKLTSDGKATGNGNNSGTSNQTSCNKAKKISAHAGVYRTPSKAVPCHLCKLTFKSILDYTNHNLSSHGNNKASGVIYAGKDVGKCNFGNNA